MDNAKNIMETNIITVTPDTEISRAVKILLDNHINGVPVVHPLPERSDLPAERNAYSPYFHHS